MQIRNIAFKAKRKDNGEWVEGSLIITEGSVAYIIRSKSKAFIPKGKNIICSAECYEINPDTLCQYTGLTDKNGKKIWENDIVEERHRGVITMRYHVLWDFKETSWMFETKSSARYGIYAINQRKFEVVGNIFDNPDLLEVK